MRVDAFAYHLPRELIAQQPPKSRAQAGLMVLDRRKKTIRHHKFFELPKFLQPGDVLVLNNTKVFPARLIGQRPTGGKIEIFLLKPIKGQVWQVLIGGKRRKEGLAVHFKQGLKAVITQKLPDQTWLTRFNQSPKKLMATINKIGQAPTPPYIKRQSNLREYQTVYAQHLGSVAAPTAGFHFTKQLLNQLQKQGVQLEYVTLHVGLGTFAPVRTDLVEDHQMHAEYAILNQATARRLNQAKKAGRRLIAVGTTSVRVLESFTKKQANRYALFASRSYINTFIYPGYKFKIIDAMITNFHLPQSTLLMLVSAFAGTNFIKKAYQEAINKKYRFYSFGDAMLIL